MGKALYKYYDGKPLDPEKLTLIASSSLEDKLTALNFNAGERLKMRTDSSFDNFTKNCESLKVVKFDNKKK